MQEKDLRKKVAIVGVGESDAVGKVPNKSPLKLQAEAAKHALEDAGLERKDIDAIIVAPPLSRYWMCHSLWFQEYMRLPAKRASSIELGGATGCIAVEQAMTMIVTGLATNVLISTGDAFLSSLSRHGAVSYMPSVSMNSIDEVNGGLIVSLYAMLATRHMHEYGTTNEQMAAVAVAQRKHASLNPRAAHRTPLTIEDVLESKMISSPLHMYDCALVSDGGAAFVVSSAERAKDMNKPPVYVLGTGQGHSGHMHISQAETLTTSACKQSGEMAFGMAGVAPDDIDVAELYDCFTITAIIELEDLGFCKKGEGGAFVEGGAIELGGKLPLNTHGGLLSYAHPGLAGGMFAVVEGVRQVRGECGPRQVEGAELATVHGNGGVLGTHGTLILGK